MRIKNFSLNALLLLQLHQFLTVSFSGALTRPLFSLQHHQQNLLLSSRERAYDDLSLCVRALQYQIDCRVVYGIRAVDDRTPSTHVDRFRIPVDPFRVTVS